jgi:hypothetical protein
VIPSCMKCSHALGCPLATWCFADSRRTAAGGWKSLARALWIRKRWGVLVHRECTSVLGDKAFSVAVSAVSVEVT